MGIRSDAHSLLSFLYTKHNQGIILNEKDLLDSFEWDSNRIRVALRYLKDLNAVSMFYRLGEYKGLQKCLIDGLTSLGVNLHEDYLKTIPEYIQDSNSATCPKCKERIKYLINSYKIFYRFSFEEGVDKTGMRDIISKDHSSDVKYECPVCSYLIATNSDDARNFLRGVTT